MNQYLLTDGKVQVPMIHYLNKILRDLPEYLGTLSASPAANHLLKLRPEEEALPPPVEQAVAFNHVVEQLLFLSSKYSREIKTAEYFLTPRVKQPDEDDWGKLKRVLRYLKGMRGLKLTLYVDDM